MYETVAALAVVFVSIWAIVLPEPEENPDAVPLVRAAVHVNVVVPELPDKAMLVADPLEIDWDEGVAVATGLDFTVTTTCFGEPVQPNELVSTTERV